MSAKPIDEFLQECTGWLEKIAAAKQREEAAYAAISNVQMEKKSFRALARGAGHVARAVGGLASAPGRYLSRLGRRLINWGSKPKANNSLQNPLTKQVSSKSGPQTRMMRMQDGTYKAHISPPKPKSTQQAGKPADPATTVKTPAPAKPTSTVKTPAPANPAAPVKAPVDLTKRLRVDAKGNVYSLKTGQKYTGDRLARLKLSPEQISKLPQFEKAKGIYGQFVRASNKFRTDNGMHQLFNNKMQRISKSTAGAEMTQPGMFQKAMPYALVGGAGFLVGRNTAPDPVYMSPAMMHNNMMYQQMQQAATPNIY